MWLDSHSIKSEGSLGAYQSAHGVARDSHTPSTAVRCSQEEPLSNVTEMEQPQTPAALHFAGPSFATPFCGNATLTGVCVAAMATEDDSSEKQHKSSFGSSFSSFTLEIFLDLLKNVF